jgi:hydroxyacylglutathione hydrolase
MTFLGTNTYLIGDGDVAVIDPGPDDERHLDALLSSLDAGERITHVFVTHSHRDHSPLARQLSRHTGAPILAFGDAHAAASPRTEILANAGQIGGGEGIDRAFRPDVCLTDDMQIEGRTWFLRSIWTPGHFGNHLCFQWGDRVFSGDHVMGWATSLVSPPHGDMAAYMRSLRRLQALNARILYPGHGAPVDAPRERIETLVAHRTAREAQIIASLNETPQTLAELRLCVYPDTPPALARAAERNLLAHLIDLIHKGIARADGELSQSARFLLA